MTEEPDDIPRPPLVPIGPPRRSPAEIEAIRVFALAKGIGVDFADDTYGDALAQVVAAVRAHDAEAGHAIGGLRVAMITASMEDCEDFPEGPCVILRGSVEAVKAAGQLFGEAVALSVIPAAPEATR
jgi:hypothetical protein